MKILILSPYLPHPQATHGTGVFMYGLLSRLCDHHQITLVSFCDAEEVELAQGLNHLPIRVHVIPRAKGRQKSFTGTLALSLVRGIQLVRSIVLWHPYYVEKFRSRALSRLVRDLTAREPYDIVQCEFPFMGSYRREVRSGKTVLHEHDVQLRPAYRRYRNARSPLLRAAYYAEWCRWASYEPRLARLFHHVITSTEQDRLLLQRFARVHHVSHVPRGIDVPDSPPPYASRIPRSILFIGTFSHSPNLEAAYLLVREIFPRLLAQHPDARLTIIGANPPEGLRTAASRHPGIQLPGYVDDLIPHLRSAAVFVAPLRSGGGVKLKIMQAFSQALPVVTTRIGIEGIEGAESGAALLAASSAGMTTHILDLFSNPAKAAAIGVAGHAVALRSFSWSAVLACLDQTYEQIQQRPHDRPS